MSQDIIKQLSANVQDVQKVGHFGRKSVFTIHLLKNWPCYLKFRGISSKKMSRRYRKIYLKIELTYNFKSFTLF